MKTISENLTFARKLASVTNPECSLPCSEKTPLFEQAVRLKSTEYCGYIGAHHLILRTAPCRPSVVKRTIIDEVSCAYLNFTASRIRLGLILVFCSPRQARDFGRRNIVMGRRRIRCERVGWVVWRRWSPVANYCSTFIRRRVFEFLNNCQLVNCNSAPLR
jgi:hypothetical protein